MRRFLSVTRLWILAIPLALFFVGVGLNQIVLAANHNKFPVMLNERKVVAMTPDSWGIIDNDDHEVMTDKTHLNFLADWIDLKDAIYSPGDLLIETGMWAWDYAPTIWIILIISDLLRRDSWTEMTN